MIYVLSKKLPAFWHTAGVKNLISRYNRRIWHLAKTQVAGLHRAVPSAALYKGLYKIFIYILYYNMSFVNNI